MKRRLFLTGPMGCGKSTIIATAIGEKLPEFGGFLTKRLRNDDGQAIAFYLESPDGKHREVFLDCQTAPAQIHMDAFTLLAPKLLRGAYLVLDEIGGLELLCPPFMQALDALLAADIPVIGVVKGEGPASAMVRKLGLTETYELAAQHLRERLRADPDTLVYNCGQHDEEALRLAKAWVKEYAHG